MGLMLKPLVFSMKVIVEHVKKSNQDGVKRLVKKMEPMEMVIQ